jgi:hypothetical protein
MFSEKEVVKIKNIPHSNDTIRRRIDKMSQDKSLEKNYSEETVPLQLDETICISNCAQLVVFVRYIDDEYEKGIREQI